MAAIFASVATMLGATGGGVPGALQGARPADVEGANLED